MASAGTTPFYGREHELRRLQELAGKKTASLVIIKGRRRIGKSRLATELARRLPGYGALSFQGLPPTAHLTAGQEREDFAQQINRQLGIPAPRADDWNTLLWSLADRTRTGRHLLVLDEINWLGSKDPTFLGKLKNAWDAEFSQNPHLILILSGSLSGWIERNILHHTGFLGRVSLDFTLPELPLATCNLFWGKHRDRITPHEKLRLLSVTGGVPRYLEEMNPTLSADVNIQRMADATKSIARSWRRWSTALWTYRNYTRHSASARPGRSANTARIWCRRAFCRATTPGTSRRRMKASTANCA